MKIVVRLKVQFCTDGKYQFNLQRNSFLKGDGSYYQYNVFYYGDDISPLKFKAVKVLRELEKTVVSNDEKLTAKMEKFIQTAITNIMMEHKCDISLGDKEGEKEFYGTTINYVQLVADEVIPIEEE